MVMAERELAAFLGAVTELYGAEQAGISAEVWLDELQARNSLPGLTTRDWRAITIGALARLTSRLDDPEAIPSSDCVAA